MYQLVAAHVTADDHATVTDTVYISAKRHNLKPVHVNVPLCSSSQQRSQRKLLVYGLPHDRARFTGTPVR